MSNENRQREFSELQNTAARYLTQPAAILSTPSLEGWHPQIRLWHFPAFDKQRVWAVFQRNRPSDRERQTLLRQIIWDRPADANRLFNPLQGLSEGLHTFPTINVRDRQVDTSEFEKHLAPLREISFPPFAAQGIGLDGESFGVELEWRHIRVEWWCNGPDSWREIAAWAADIRVWLESIAMREDADDNSLGHS